MKITGEYPDGSIIEFARPSDQVLFWIKPDWLTILHRFDIRVNNLTEQGLGTPCVFRSGLKGSAPLYKPMWINPVELDAQAQLFAADLLAYRKFGMSFTALPESVRYASFFVALPVIGKYLATLDPFQRAFIVTKFTALFSEGLAYCNNVSWGEEDVYWNYIKNENPGAPWPKMHALVDGTDTYSGVVDGDYVRLDSWLPGNLPTSYDISILADYRVSWCTIIRPTEIDGGFSVYQFPQLEGYSVPRPFITKEPVYFWKDEVVIYEGTRRPPYWPPREGAPLAG